MNGEGKLRMELVRTGIPSYGWYIFDGQVTCDGRLVPLAITTIYKVTLNR
jgi:hypothetical protein